MIDFFAGVLIAALAGMGVGGGGLLVLYLVFVEKVGQLEAQGINLIFFICASAASLFYHGKKRKINYKLTFFLILVGAAGAVLGAVVADMLNPETVRKIFGWMLMLSGVLVLFKKKEK